MIIQAISKSGISSIMLPSKKHGQFWVSAPLQSKERIISIEGIDNQWVMKSNRDYKIILDGGIQRSVVLEEGTIYLIKNQNDEVFFVYTEGESLGSQTFNKFLVEDGVDIYIGRNETNDICFNSSFVSSNHAIIMHRNNRWYIKDNESRNGVFVNDKRVYQTELESGDYIYIMGLRIVIGKDLIAVNNPENKVTVATRLIPFMMQSDIEREDEEEQIERDYFYRIPRFKRDVEKAVIKVDAPPPSPISEELPWILVMGTSFAMGGMSLVMLATAISNSNITSAAMGITMLFGTVLFPVITKQYEKRRKERKEALRKDKYRSYLEHLSGEINDVSLLQTEILNENHITCTECEKRILGVDRSLWERRYGQNDFLTVRLGKGQSTLDAEISYNERHFCLEEDVLQEEMYLLCERPMLLNDIPITISLFEDHISGLIGNKQEIFAFAKSLLFQLSAFYSYDEVKFVFFYDIADDDEWRFVKWLPHTWDDKQKFRYIARNESEAKEVSSQLEAIIEQRKDLNPDDMDEVSPYYIVFSLSHTLSVRSDALKQIFSEKENLHFSVLSIFEELKKMPVECSKIVEIDGARGKLFDRNDISGQSIMFETDDSVSIDPFVISAQLSNIFLDNTVSHYSFPPVISFLELFEAGRVEHLNILSRWQENDPTKSLEAAVGVNVLGDVFKLDLHEKFHGPHGLIAGMTGSGKSEFIITYILSLAINYHPNEVAFILIDYKGGGMAKSFQTLPHTAGIITNLDGAAIKRSLVSIESELKRRQALFSAASEALGVSNIDIYKYQKLYREKKVLEPLQHLFIISDEFAELKAQQPEFMAQLISTARIGRSLGVHLILATQKPSGVVDDQIWSNSKFKICLRVQERADSMDMLKRPDAAELTDTGRFYLQVGYNELFEMGQSAWAGAPYYPADKVVPEKDNSVVVVDINGHVIKEAKIDKRQIQFASARKQIDVVAEYIKDIAQEEKIKIKPMWLDPIPGVILLSDLITKYQLTSKRLVLNPLIGEYDDPAHQRQAPLRVPLSKEGNVAIFGSSGSGKTTFLNALLFSLIREHRPDEVNLYVLDFASETLRAFASAPHVGEVLLSDDSEKITNLFKMLQKEITDRKKRFSDYGGDYNTYIKATGSALPAIVVVINNYMAFTETYEELEEAALYLSREGVKSGLYFVLTSPAVNGIRFRMLQNFKQLFTLQLNDSADYSTVVGKTEGLVPSKHKGRGLVRLNDLFEFQVAYITRDAVPFNYIRKWCFSYKTKWNGPHAKRVPILPDQVDLAFIKDYVQDAMSFTVPIGIEKESMSIHRFPFGSSYLNLVLSSGNEYQSTVSALSALLGTVSSEKVMVFDPQSILKGTCGSAELAQDKKRCTDCVSKLFDTVLYRNNTYKDALAEERTIEPFERMFVLINSLSTLKDILDKESNEKLSLVLEKGSVNYGITIIIGEQSKALSAYSYEKWYKTNVSGSRGIWVGNGFSEQYQLKANRTTADLHKQIPSGFGYAVFDGECVLLKLLSLGEAGV